jgi:thiamine phosphate synthase YjbQ (UPF0047 family)
MSTVTNTKIIITQFTELIDTNKKYEKKELVNILNKVYDQVNKKKKEPTLYNIFVRENMSKVKEANHNLSRQDLMRKIAELWKQNKKIDDNNTEIDEKKLDKINDNNKIEEKDLDKNEEKDLDKNEEKDLDKIEEKDLDKIKEKGSKLRR